MIAVIVIAGIFLGYEAWLMIIESNGFLPHQNFKSGHGMIQNQPLRLKPGQQQTVFGSARQP
jgi:hypothetical protein